RKVHTVSVSVNLVQTLDVGSSAFLRDVLQGLARQQKELPCKYFYDETGSRLFDEICELPEYYLTRTELAIMHQRADEMVSAIGRGRVLIEYGSGSSMKTRLLLERAQSLAGYVPIDISAAQLASAVHELRARYPALPIWPVCADYTSTYNLPCWARNG